ncbi:MAG: DUF4011 domain-containing protein [Chloroflexota bacterium]
MSAVLYSSPTQNTLSTLRKELLDLGLRNPLLNFRTMKARGIQLSSRDCFQLYANLVGSGKAFTFTTAQQSAGPLALHTPYDEETLQKRLLYSQDLAEAYIQEKGVNILFLAIGMVYWQPFDRPHPLRAPLLLVPVRIRRETIKAEYVLEHTQTGIAENLTLKTKLFQEFGVTLPEFQQDDPFYSFEKWHNDVEDGVSITDRVRVAPNEIEVGFFAYNRLVLYQDLDPENWKNRPNKVVEALYGDIGFREPLSKIKPNGRVDQYIDPAQSHLVLDADSTQLMSLIDAMDGRNLVIQGPPGTGKSQTITNLIAEALGQGKKVLFVAEKMAALEVVQRKLAALGLEDLALELHSHKTTKRDFAEMLNRSLTLGKPRKDGNQSRLNQVLLRTQKKLNDHTFLMNRPIRRQR